EGLQWAAAGEQEVAAHQVGEAEIRVVVEQRVDAAKRVVEAVLLDRLEHLREPLLGRGRRGERRGRQEEGDQREKQSLQGDFSSRISQRPSARVMTRVLRLELFSLSER